MCIIISALSVSGGTTLLFITLGRYVIKQKEINIWQILLSLFLLFIKGKYYKLNAILNYVTTFQGVYNEKLLVGDSGYSQTWVIMMTPLPENTTSTRGKKKYQESQIRTRNVIERTFGIWKRRFPILSKGINVKLRRVPGKTISLP